MSRAPATAAPSADDELVTIKVGVPAVEYAIPLQPESIRDDRKTGSTSSSAERRTWTRTYEKMTLRFEEGIPTDPGYISLDEAQDVFADIVGRSLVKRAREILSDRLSESGSGPEPLHSPALTSG